MPEIEKKEHDYQPGKEEDIIVKAGNFRVYFQNYYTIISLGNDLFTGILYLSGSLVQTFTDLETVGMYLYIFASFFLLMRPILKIMHSVFIYREEEYQTKVLGEDTEESVKRSKGQTDKPTKEVELKSNDKAEKDEQEEKESQAGDNEGMRQDFEGEKKRSDGAETEADELTEESEEIEEDYNENYYGHEKNE
ncbi:MAG: YrhK family protein [Alkalibacterium sp.]|nr:YrhK family protein [Alkalibacterium sp.]